MASRLELHEVLCEILGSRHVYYQPPESIKMNYPAIVYSLRRIDNDFANDNVYMQSHSYEVIVIDKDPDSLIVDKISRIPRCQFDRPYTSQGLNHSVFILFY